MAEKFGTHRFSYETITRQAIGGWNRDREVNVVYDPTDTDSGLSGSEIRNALAATGASSIAIIASGSEAADSTACRLTHELYSFVESGFPVILCLEDPEGDSGHAVVAVGHHLRRLEDTTGLRSVSELFPNEQFKTPPDSHYLVSSIVNLYYVHDDSYGPFNRITIKNFTAETVDGKTGIPVERGQDSKPLFLTEVIVPTPPFIKNSAYQPLLRLIRRFEESIAEPKPHNDVFLWRSLLVEGALFKQSVVKRDYSDELCEWYATLHMPKYVWLYEVSKASRDNFGELFSEDGRFIDGEFLFDATCPYYDVNNRISERFAGYRWDYRGIAFPPMDSNNLYECFR